MQLRVGVFDIWLFRRDTDPVSYLLLHTSQEKADRWFHGGRFWQVPSDVVADGEALVPAVRRCLSGFGVTAGAIWAAEHVYTIYNPRFEEVQQVLVLAAEVQDHASVRIGWEHSEYRWMPAQEADALVRFRGLRDGLASVRRFVTEAGASLPELRLA